MIEDRERLGIAYKVYCDESRYEGPHAHRFMAIGGLWIPAEREPVMLENFAAICSRRQISSEVKWSRIKARSLAGNQEFVDLFFAFPSAAFRCIVVDQSRVDLARYHANDQELGFYKFYYEMLEKWILPGNRYRILLDYKENRDPRRYDTLLTFLQKRAAKVGARIAGLNTIDSASDPMVQICDLLTGAVAASSCEDLRPDSPKAKLAEYIAKRAGFLSLKNSSLSPRFSKFNVFRIELR